MTTGQNLVDRALDYADMTSSNFPVELRVRDLINNGLSRLHYRLAQADIDWFSSMATIPVVAGTGTYALPTGTTYGACTFTATSNTAGAVALTITVGGVAVVLTSGVDFALGATNSAADLLITCTNLAAAINANATLLANLIVSVSSPVVTVTMRASCTSLTTATNQALRIATATSLTPPGKYFRLRQLYIKIGDARYTLGQFQRSEIDGALTAPTISGSLNMFYVHEFAPLTTALVTYPTGAWSAVIDTTYPAGWEDYVAHHAAKMLLQREESFEAAKFQDQECNICMSEIMQVVAPRAGGIPDRVQEAYGRWCANSQRTLWVPRYMYRIEGMNLELIQSSYYPYGA